MMQDADFRTRQVLADLARIPGAGIIADPWTVAFGVETRPADLWASLAGIVQLVMDAGSPDPALDDLWLLHRKAVTAAPAPIRAALMNGVGHLRTFGLVELAGAPAANHLITTPLRKLAPALVAIARRMTRDEREQVARADYGCDVARHRAALEVLLDDPAVAYPEGEYWFPAEVVELVSHVPGKPGHVPCLAIVLLDALRSGDRQGNAEFRLEQQFAEIAALEPQVRDMFFAAFRHLYESDPGWSPAVPAPFTLPWVSLRQT